MKLSWVSWLSEARAPNYPLFPIILPIHPEAASNEHREACSVEQELCSPPNRHPSAQNPPNPGLECSQSLCPLFPGDSALGPERGNTQPPRERLHEIGIAVYQLRFG